LFLANPDVCEGGSGGTFTLPNGAIQRLVRNLRTAIGSVASQILANQQQYQAATVSAGPASNPSYINPNTLADGLNVTGTDLLYPKYVSPRSVQMNFGIEQEIRKGMVVTADYLRNIETHTLLAIDTNHVGDARFFNATQRHKLQLRLLTGSSGNCTNRSPAAQIDCAIGLAPR
jgi:hypothetical protein